MATEQGDSQKVGVTLTLDTIKTIDRLASMNNVNKATIIEDSVKINEILTDAWQQAAKILIRYTDGTMKEIVVKRS